MPMNTKPIFGGNLVYPSIAGDHLICKLCGQVIETNYGSARVYIICHFTRHSTGMLILFQSGVGIQFRSSYTYTVGCNNLAYLFPQMSFLEAVNANEFRKNIERIISKKPSKIMPGSINIIISNIQISPKFQRKKDELIRLVVNTQYKCSRIVYDPDYSICGQIYEPGMPSIDLVEKHMESHISSIGAYVKTN